MVIVTAPYVELVARSRAPCSQHCPGDLHVDPEQVGGGRTPLDLAALAHAQGHREATAAHCHAAHAVFTALHLPMYVERTAQRTSEYGVRLGTLERVGQPPHSPDMTAG